MQWESERAAGQTDVGESEFSSVLVKIKSNEIFAIVKTVHLYSFLMPEKIIKKKKTYIFLK